MKIENKFFLLQVTCANMSPIKSPYYQLWPFCKFQYLDVSSQANIIRSLQMMLSIERRTGSSSSWCVKSLNSQWGHSIYLASLAWITLSLSVSELFVTSFSARSHLEKNFYTSAGSCNLFHSTNSISSSRMVLRDAVGKGDLDDTTFNNVVVAFDLNKRQ